MKQIYYTQCPIGYGLGASNGFQIKRLSDGYPVSSDFRHFGLRAFVAGTRVPSPPTLRYRRGEDGAAEVAWLTPRSHEYETERGLWGRPGGHFVHGLRLDDTELKALADWPAGLYDAPFWVRSDPRPSGGEPPPALALSTADLRWPPTFERVAPLAGAEDVERLARSLTAAAQAARERRSLFLIGPPAAVADRIALLTFALPPPWRADLTFSTYHDRPEELPGFRLQGTIPAARPNRRALLSLGIVEDLEAGTIEPSMEPARWSLTLAGWLIRREPADARAWNELEALLRRAGAGQASATLWAADWIESLFDVHQVLRGAAARPLVPDDWSRLGTLTTWVSASRLSRSWSRARGPSWWNTHADGDSQGREALLLQLALPEAWTTEAADEGWGEAFARWYRASTDEERRMALLRALATIPEGHRAGFLQVVLRGWPLEALDGTLRWLKGQPGLDPSLLLPSEVRAAVDQALGRGDPRPLVDVLCRAIETPIALPATLDAMEYEAGDRTEIRTRLAEHVADALERSRPASRHDAQRWALRQGANAEAWLGPFLRRVFAQSHDRDEWEAIRDRTPAELRPTLARIVLRVTESLADRDGFCWAVEELLLPLGEADRPHEPSWPGAYLDGNTSDLRLLDRLFDKGEQGRSLLDWLQQAHQRDELGPQRLDRLRNLKALYRVVRSGDARGLSRVEGSAIPASDRAGLLARLVARVDTASLEALNDLLDWCGGAWPRCFETNGPGLDAFAEALADAAVLVAARRDPAWWWNAVLAILDHLLPMSDEKTFQPGALAAALVAATARRLVEESDRWAFRRFLLFQERGWQTLAADVRRDLAGLEPSAGLPLVRGWDDALDKGPWTSRFFEAFLNAADGPLMAEIVRDRAGDLKGLDLTWWSFAEIPGAAPDLRDRFARSVPIAPLSEVELAAIERWLFPVRRIATSPGYPEPANTGGLVPLDPVDPARQASMKRDASGLSEFGRIRWRCISALSEFVNTAAILSKARWSTLMESDSSPRLDQLPRDERYRFVAWLIHATDELELDLGLVSVNAFAEWLWKVGVRDARQMESGWARELSGMIDIPHEIERDRARFAREVAERLALLDYRARNPL